MIIAEKLTFLMAFPLFALTVYTVVKRANVRSTVVIITLVHVLSIDSPENQFSKLLIQLRRASFLASMMFLYEFSYRLVYRLNGLLRHCCC